MPAVFGAAVFVEIQRNLVVVPGAVTALIDWLRLHRRCGDGRSLSHAQRIVAIDGPSATDTLTARSVRNPTASLLAHWKNRGLFHDCPPVPYIAIASAPQHSLTRTWLHLPDSRAIAPHRES